MNEINQSMFFNFSEFRVLVVNRHRCLSLLRSEKKHLSRILLSPINPTRLFMDMLFISISDRDECGWIVCFVKKLLLLFVLLRQASRRLVGGWRRLHYYCTHLCTCHILSQPPRVHPSIHPIRSNWQKTV